MTKAEYIRSHPKSKLAAALQSTGWPDDQPIEVIGGLIAPNNKNSKLNNALQNSTLGEYVVGGHRQRGTEGWWIAVA